jgi:hypothetical protein
LVVFDGSARSGWTLQKQIDLFRSANVVIGAHGGGLANLIWMTQDEEQQQQHQQDTGGSPPDACPERLKVLEFITNPLTPDIQHGKFHVTYYNLYSKVPWVEYHQLLYQPQSNHDTTFLDIGEFRDALVHIFSNGHDRAGNALSAK